MPAGVDFLRRHIVPAGTNTAQNSRACQIGRGDGDVNQAHEATFSAHDFHQRPVFVAAENGFDADSLTAMGCRLQFCFDGVRGLDENFLKDWRGSI